MPTKRLPSRPNLEHLKHQAKDLLNGHRSGDPSVLQRIREFHPAFNGLNDAAIRAGTYTLSDAQLTIAHEYGFASWARLRTHTSDAGRPKVDLPHHERIEDPTFRRAVELLDDGDLDGLRDYLASHPGLVRQRVMFEAGNYFRDPTLLEFVAENPVRHDNLPPNIVDIARAILDAGARTDQRSVNSTLGLVSSGRVPRECGVQVRLIDLLCDYSADPTGALGAALGHGEFEAVDALILRGATLDLAGAAALGRIEDVRRALPAAGIDVRHCALAWAAQYGHRDIVQLLLDAGEDPNRFNPPGTHSHSTPLHQAALAGHGDVVRLLVERGARRDIRDIHHQGTPLEWAEYGGRAEVAEYLRAQDRRSLPTLDSLKKTAERWLTALRSGDPDAQARLRHSHPDAPAEPGLRDVQHALAREEGHASWRRLRQELDHARLVAADSPNVGLAWPYWQITDLGQFDDIAEAMVQVHERGDAAAARRLSERYGFAVTADALRAEVRRRLDELLDAERPTGAFALPHARLVLARDAGYENWEMLAAALGTDSRPRPRPRPNPRDVIDQPAALAAPIQPAELTPTLPMEMRDGEYSTTTEVWRMLVASRAGNLARVKELVASTPGLVSCYYNYMPPLHLAVREGHMAMVRYLLEQGALDPDDVTYPYREPFLTIAEDRGYDEIASLLKEYARRPAAGRPRKKTHQGPGYIRFEPNEERTQLERLISTNALEAVDVFVTKRPYLLHDELAGGGEGILASVAHRPNRPMLELLLRNGARVPDVTKWGRAYYFKHYFIAALLLEHGMNPNHMTWHRTTLLHEIVWEGDVRKARLLLDHGADIDAVDEEFRSTPLGMAARWGRLEMTRLLLDRGADPNRSGAPWATPLAWAERKGHSEIVSELRARGAR